MARVIVKISGVDKFVKSQFSFIKRLSERQLSTVANETAILMKQKIEESITRAGSTGNLANSIFSEKTPDGFGVGNISFLNKQAPYWRHVNFGSEAIGASHNHRVPQGAFSPGTSAPVAGNSGGRWSVGTGSFSFIPTKPIAPLNYIAKTLQEIPSLARNIVDRG